MYIDRVNYNRCVDSGEPRSGPLENPVNTRAKYTSISVSPPAGAAAAPMAVLGFIVGATLPVNNHDET